MLATWVGSALVVEAVRLRSLESNPRLVVAPPEVKAVVLPWLS
jgi:hypothetical protein